VTTTNWSPQSGAVGTAWAGGVVTLALAVLAEENTGRLLLGLAAVLLLFLALYGTIARPRLTADDTGLAVRGLTGRRHWPWHDVTVRLVHSRRLGRDSQSLELDCRSGEDEHLIVLTRLDLGTDPVEVADVLHALRP
jgi:hypothetical protein